MGQASRREAPNEGTGLMRLERMWARGSLLAGAAVGGLLVFSAGGALAATDAPIVTAAAALPADARQQQLDGLQAQVDALAAQVNALKAAAPQSAPIEALQAQVNALAAQIADLKTATSAGIKDVRSATLALPQVTFPSGRPTISTANGDFKVALRTVLQFDAAHYSESPLTTANDLSSGTNFRRARFGIDATVYKDWNIALWGDWGGSGGETPVLNQAYVEYAGWKPFGLKNPLRLRVGAWATPTGLEDATSNTDGLFLERPAVAEMVRNLSGGDGRSGVGFFANGDHWYVSGTFTGAVVGVAATPEFGEQMGYLARVAFNPIHGMDYDVHVGANIQGILRPADTAAGPAVAEAVRLRERPEIRVDGTRLVDTGAITSDGLTAYGLEGGASWKSFYVAGEWYRTDVSRTAVGAGASPFDPSFDGWYIQGAWTVTGERHPWNSGNGGFRGVRPAKPFDPTKGTWGAWELAARYSVLNLDDQAGVAGAPAPAGGIRGGDQKITTVGINWYPNNVVRFLFDFQNVDVSRLDKTGADIGENVKVYSFRSQFAF